MLNHDVSVLKSKTVLNLGKELLAKILALEESKRGVGHVLPSF